MPPDASVNDVHESSTPSVEGQGQPPSAGRARRLTTWAKQHRFKAVILILSAGTSLGAIFALYLALNSGSLGADVTMANALAALDEGRLADARRIAMLLRNSPHTDAEHLGGPVFILGAAAAYEAAQTRNPERKELYLVASRYLEEARDRGFPEGRASQGLLLLGRSLYDCGEPAASRTILHEALAADPKQSAEIHLLLAETNLNDAIPDYDAALKENSLYLADRGLSATARQQGLLQRAKLLLALGQITECKDTLAKIPADAANRAEATLLRGQVLLREAEQLPGAEQGDTPAFRQGVEAALADFRQAEAQDTLSSQVSGKAMYLIGLSFLKLKDYRAALNQFSRLPKLHPDSPEAMAGGFQEADLARRLGKQDDAVAKYCQVLDQIGTPETPGNPWLPRDELGKQIMAVHQQYVSAGQFALASKVANHLHPLFSRRQQKEIVARTYRGWGDSLLAQAESLPATKAEAAAKQGREHLRRAGRQYQQLAQLDIADRQYPDDLWESATCYLDGHDFLRAADLFQQYLKNESRRRHATALVSLGEALLATDHLDEALAACLECIDLHSRDPATFRARLLAARASVAKGEPDKAKKLLLENLNGESLTPASTEWRESLFDLGKLLFREGAYEEAIDRLREAVQRYPDVRQSLSAQYCLAEAYTLYARQLEVKLKEDRVESTRTARARKVRELLGLALAEYRKLQEKLVRHQEAAELSPVEQLMLRNCFFSTGYCLYQLQQYEDSIKAYVMATNRYQNRPEVLDAYLQIARAYRKLNKPAEARGALEQAKMVLTRLKPDASFKDTTNASREQWTQLLDKLTAS